MAVAAIGKGTSKVCFLFSFLALETLLDDERGMIGYAE
jgi:hypothetical protein